MLDTLYTTTTTRTDYKTPRPLTRPKLITPADVPIEAHILINRKLCNNLYIQPKPTAPTKQPHAFAKDHDEKYTEYGRKMVERFPKRYNEELFNEDALKGLTDNISDMHRTNYQLTHCRREDGFKSEKSKRRAAKNAGLLPKGWLIDTTNQSSYRSPHQLADYATIDRTRSCKWVDVKYSCDEILREVFQIRGTTYGREMCELAQLNLQKSLYNNVRPGPIDQYTYRIV